MKLSLIIKDREGRIKASACEENETTLLYENIYMEGDVIEVHSSAVPVYLQLKLDDALEESFTYMTKQTTVFVIPFGQKKKAYSLKSFSGGKHWLSVRKVHDFELHMYQNVAKNCFDQKELDGLYPHVSANIETRGEAVFEARNVIDGLTETHSHGRWPNNSWGINQQDDAKLKLDFGRTVEIDRMIIYLRADFPHDNWWKSGVFTFSDGSAFQGEFIKSGQAQEFLFEKKRVTWITLDQLLKAETESPFPALRQWKVYGKELT